MYIGYLFCVGSKWLEAVSTRTSPRAAICVSPHLSDEIRGGDPVFFILGNDQKPVIYLHARVAMYHEDALEAIWSKRGQLAGLGYGHIVLGSEDIGSSFGANSRGLFLLLSEIKPISPPVPCDMSDITSPRDEKIRKLTPGEVLAILRALPPEAQTAWTKRVVARNNDLPVVKG